MASFIGLMTVAFTFAVGNSVWEDRIIMAIFGFMATVYWCISMIRDVMFVQRRFIHGARVEASIHEIMQRSCASAHPGSAPGPVSESDTTPARQPTGGGQASDSTRTPDPSVGPGAVSGSAHASPGRRCSPWCCLRCCLQSSPSPAPLPETNATTTTRDSAPSLTPPPEKSPSFFREGVLGRQLEGHLPGLDQTFTQPHKTGCHRLFSVFYHVVAPILFAVAWGALLLTFSLDADRS